MLIEIAEGIDGRHGEPGPGQDSAAARVETPATTVPTRTSLIPMRDRAVA